MKLLLDAKDDDIQEIREKRERKWKQKRRRREKDGELCEVFFPYMRGGSKPEKRTEEHSKIRIISRESRATNL